MFQLQELACCSVCTTKDLGEPGKWVALGAPLLVLSRSTFKGAQERHPVGWFKTIDNTYVCVRVQINNFASMLYFQ